MKSRIFRQRPVRGGRDPLPSSVLHSIELEVEAQAKRYGVSKSFVIATVLAKAFGVDDQEDYRTAAIERVREEKRKRRVKTYAA